MKSSRRVERKERNCHEGKEKGRKEKIGTASAEQLGRRGRREREGKKQGKRGATTVIKKKGYNEGRGNKHLQEVGKQSRVDQIANTQNAIRIRRFL